MLYAMLPAGRSARRRSGPLTRSQPAVSPLPTRRCYPQPVLKRGPFRLSPPSPKSAGTRSPVVLACHSEPREPSTVRGLDCGEGHVLGHFPARERTRTLVSECGDAADAVLADSGPDWSPVPPISSVSRSACPTGRARPSGRSAGPGSSGGRRASSVVRQRRHRRPARRRRSLPCTCPRCRSAA